MGDLVEHGVQLSLLGSPIVRSRSLGFGAVSSFGLSGCRIDVMYSRKWEAIFYTTFFMPVAYVYAYKVCRTPNDYLRLA